MAFKSIKNVLDEAALVTPAQFDEWSKAWRVAVESGSQEQLLGFFCRESGLAEDVFLQKLAQALGWPYLELPKLTVPNEARDKISTKVAFQFLVLPTQLDNGSLQVAVSNPFDAAMLN
ncbi:MAG: type II/IV secretion system protein, partial [Verrucomicrobia bacterium]|nr:type II/IV secretion system protein [Verrucomicrobiota bacterium]